MSPVKLTIIGIISIVVFVLALAAIPFTIVSAGERVVILRLGAVSRVLDEGVHWVTPFVESVKTLDVQTQKEQVEATAASKDLQTVHVIVALNYNLIPDKVGELWKEIGYDYKSKIIDPAIQEAVKAATAKHDASELITKREEVKDEIKNLLKERLATVYMNVTEASIINFEFSTSFNQAIEAKVTAEQNALQAKNKLEQVKFEAEQRVAGARAEAEAIKVQSEAANNEKYIQLKQLDVQKVFAEKWNGVLPVNMLSGSPIPFIDFKTMMNK